MCLAVPMKVIELDLPIATVEVEGVRREVRADFLPDLALGDYVLVHAGIAIERVDPDEAEETLRLMQEISDEIR
jgi:hydrogenase expression/formation protein HypC